jgi:hypothetical protein
MNKLAGLILASCLLAPLTALHAADKPSTTDPKSDHILLSEDFSGTAIPANWQPGGRSNSFRIVEGALQGVCLPDDHHGPSIGVPVAGRNLVIECSVRLIKPGLILFLVDGDSQYGGQAHLLRVALGDKFAALQQDRGSLESKQAQAADKAKAAKEGRKPTPPTKEQLADPKFYRTETLDRKTASLGDGQWHQVRVEINGNAAEAKVDDVVLRATGSVWDAKKARLVFLIGLAGTMQLDNVKVWER